MEPLKNILPKEDYIKFVTEARRSLGVLTEIINVAKRICDWAYDVNSSGEGMALIFFQKSHGLHSRFSYNQFVKRYM